MRLLVAAIAVFAALLSFSTDSEASYSARVLKLQDAFEHEGETAGTSPLLLTNSTATTTDGNEEEEALLLGGVKKIMGDIVKKVKGKGKKTAKKNKTPFTLPLTRRRNAFVGPVYIGTPMKKDGGGKITDADPFYVAFDTARSNSWVYGEVFKEDKGKRGKASKDDGFFFDTDHCRKKNQKQGNSKKKGDCKKGELCSPMGRCNLRNYDSRESATYKTYDPKDAIVDGVEFYDYGYDGTLASDTLKIGPKDIPRANFLVVNEMGEQNMHSETGVDGVVGLNTDRNLYYGGPAIFPLLADKKHGVLKTPAVSFYISPSGSTGEIMFGGHNQTLLADGAKMHYFKQAKAQRFVPDWTLKCDSLRLKGGKRTPIMKSFHAYFESAETKEAFITSSRERFYALPKLFRYGSEILTKKDIPILKDKEMFVIDCDKRDMLPNLELVIRKKVFSFTGTEVFPRPFINNKKLEGKCVSFFTLDRSMEKDQEEETEVVNYDAYWGIGTDFMKKYYVEFGLRRGKFSSTPYVGIGLSKGLELQLAHEGHVDDMGSLDEAEEEEGGEGEENEKEEGGDEEEKEDATTCSIDGETLEEVCPPAVVEVPTTGEQPEIISFEVYMAKFQENLQKTWTRTSVRRSMEKIAELSSTL